MSKQKVPCFKRYFASESDMGSEQARFYAQWRAAWERGETLSVDGQLSYLFCYAYSVLRRHAKEREDELQRLVSAYGDLEPKFTDYCRLWLADCKMLKGDFQAALDVSPKLALGAKWATAADQRLSLRLLTKQSPKPGEMIAMVGPKVTAWGRRHLDLVNTWAGTCLENDTDPTILERLAMWADVAHRYPHSAFSGSTAIVESGVILYSFSGLKQAVDFARAMLREAENTAREEKGLPRVGEGWIAETALYHSLRRYFAPAEVIQHARPKWLGRQHIDIFIPSLSIAVEYQGRQHDEPIEFFGGEKAWRLVRRRDAKKRRLCEKHAIRLIEVRKGYSLERVVQDILGCSESGSAGS